MSVKIKVVPKKDLWDSLEVKDLKNSIQSFIRTYQGVQDECIIESETENTMSLFINVCDTIGHIEIKPQEVQFIYYHFSKWGAYLVKKIAQSNNGGIVIHRPIKIGQRKISGRG